MGKYTFRTQSAPRFRGPRHFESRCTRQNLNVRRRLSPTESQAPPGSTLSARVPLHSEKLYHVHLSSLSTMDTKIEDSTLHEDIYITNLPKGITSRVLLDALAVGGPFGDVIYDVRTGPTVSSLARTPDCPPHLSAAVIFGWSSSGSNSIFNYIANGNLIIEGKVAECCVLEEKCNVASWTYGNYSDMSRVLVVKGDPQTVKHNCLKDYIKDVMRQRKVWFDERGMKEYVRRSKHTVVWEFVSTRCSEDAMDMLLEEVTEDGEPKLTIRYGRDPFELGAEAVLKANLRRKYVKLTCKREVPPSPSRQLRSRRKWLHRRFLDKERKKEAAQGSHDVQRGQSVPPFWPGMQDSEE